MNHDVLSPEYRFEFDSGSGSITIGEKINIVGIRWVIQYAELRRGDAVLIGRNRYTVEKRDGALYISAMEASAIIVNHGKVTTPAALVDHLEAIPGSLFPADLIAICFS